MVSLKDHLSLHIIGDWPEIACACLSLDSCGADDRDPGVKQASLIRVLTRFAAHSRTSIIKPKAELIRTSFLSQYPPNILPATAFLNRFLSLLSSPASSCQSIFLSTLPSQTSFAPPEIHLTSSPTLNFLQLALITVQRAPAVGTSNVQARGMDGGIGREWESLVGRYRRMSGATSFLGDKEVQEVSDVCGSPTRSLRLVE